MRTKPYFFGNIRSADLIWILILLLPALYINLGLLPLGSDESIRALVSLEMILSGDYISPTLNGELYYNKPPLYNWILIAFIKLFNSDSEFIFRLPTTLFLIIYCITIFIWVKKQLGVQTGILATLMFLTCGRILFRDSFLGLIDTSFSWIVFLNFMLIWHLFGKGKFLTLFIITYVLTAIGFLLKGLPAPVFQGISLLVLFIYSGKFRKLISWQHFLGIAVFTMIIALYYLLYYLRNPDNIGNLLTRIINESTQKSALGATTGRTIIHILKFPWEVTLHFAPWTLLIILLFNKSILKKSMSVPFVRYCMVVFIANLVIYWLSPVTYMRYLLMLFPLLFIVLLHLAKMHALLNTLNYRILKYLLLVGAILLIPVNSLLPIIFSKVLPVNLVFLKSTILLMAGLGALYFLHYSRNKTNLLYSLGIMLLISRIAFNIFLVPYRQLISRSDQCRNDAVMLARSTADQELYLMTDTITIPNAYYITRERNEILKFTRDYKPGPYYIVEDTALFGDQFQKEYTMRVSINNRSFYAGRFNRLFPEQTESFEILK